MANLSRWSVQGSKDCLRAAFVPERRATTFLLAVCLALVILGIQWRIVRLGYPPYLTFDEHHFVENARNYIHGRADWNDHPPLGKLVLVPSMLGLGDTSFAWRASSMVFGIALIIIAYLTAGTLFNQRKASWLAAAFVAADGFFIAYSRTALLDMPMLTFMAASFLFMTMGPHLGWFFGAAVLLGLAIATKWIAGCLFFAVPLLLLRQRRTPLHAGWMLAVVVVVYLGIFWSALESTHQPSDIATILNTSWGLLKHHAGFTDWRNAADSRWYTWPFLAHPLFLHFLREDGYVRAMSTVGNPALWYCVTASFALVPVRAGVAVWRGSSRDQPVPAPLRTYWLLFVTAAALLVQWYFTNRESYIWHYLGSYYFGILIFVGMLSETPQKYRWVLLAAVLVIGLVSVGYAPLWTNAKLDENMFKLLYFPWQG